MLRGKTSLGEKKNILIATLLHVLLISHNENPDLTFVPAFSPGEQVRHQQCQTLKERNTCEKIIFFYEYEYGVSFFNFCRQKTTSKNENINL